MKPRTAIPALALLALLACALPALAAQDTPQPAPDIQTYRLDRLENDMDQLGQRLDALPGQLEPRFSQDLERQTQATARWVESAQDSLDATQITISIITGIFAIIAGFVVILVGWRVHDNTKDMRTNLAAMEAMKAEMEAIVEKIKATGASCDAMHADIKKTYDNVDTMAAQTNPEKPRTEEDRADINTTADDPDAPFLTRLMAKALKAMGAKEWAAALGYWQAVARETPSDAAAHFHLAYCAQSLADAEPDQALPLLETACLHYEQAANNDPDNALALSNWGAALNRLATATDDLDNKVRRLKDACTKCEQATHVDPNYAMSFNNWGNALQALAEVDTNPKEKTRLLKEACAKYKQATDINTKFALAFSNWGNALQALAKVAATKDKTRLLNDACAKYKQAIDINPNLANDIAINPKSVNVLVINQLATAFSNWGIALIHLAQITDPPERKTELFNEAKEKGLKAEAIQKGMSAYNLACIAALQNDPDQCRHWLDVSLETDSIVSCEELQSDDDFASVHNELWFQELLAKICAK